MKYIYVYLLLVINTSILSGYEVIKKYHNQNIKELSHYRKDIRSGSQFKYYKNGNLKTRTIWKNDKKYYKEFGFHKNKKIKYIKNYKNNKLVDISYYYDKMGNKIIELYYDSIGNLISGYYFIHGKKTKMTRPQLKEINYRINYGR